MEDARTRPQHGQTPAAAGDRIAHRHKTFEPTTLGTARGTMRVHVLNVSATGALVHAGGGPAPGERCTIRLAGRDIAAEVMWAEGARFGIAFRGALSDDDLARLLG